MKKIFILSLFCSITIVSVAQHITPADKKILRAKEDSIKEFSVKLIQGINPADRFVADSIFTRRLVKALVIKNSFYYPFDSLKTISILYAPDSTFRIFTWQMMINENVVRQHGAIQMRTYDGSLKLFPLIDKSEITTNTLDTIGNNFGWIGAIYYKIIQKRSGNQNYYTLLGYDENNIRSTKKMIEVLTFQNDEPVFGGRYFSYEDDKDFKTSTSRYIMEFKKDAGPRLTYDADMDLIVVEHTISESNEPNKKWTYIGDGDYEGFRWKNGKWVHVDKIFNQVTPLGKEPVPDPIRDGKGNLDETKLKGNEDMEKPVPATTTKPKKKDK
jgi:hypothetical protein